MVDSRSQGGIQMYKKDCFAYREKEGIKFCSALLEMQCYGCKFYKTKSYYQEHILPLRHKKSGGV